jgi:hypothetical protein
MTLYYSCLWIIGMFSLYFGAKLVTLAILYTKRQFERTHNG